MAAIIALWLLGHGGAAAAAPRVVASITPVQSLAASVMKGVGDPRLLIAAGASPHGGALKPSQASALAAADLVFWVGPELETILAKPLAGLGGRAVALGGVQGVKRLTLREGGVWAAHEHEDHEQESHEHEGNEHEGHDDMHVWLDPENAMAMARAIATALSAADPQNAGLYRQNLAALGAEIAALDTELAAALAPVADRPFIVFHDAYHYFEDRYRLAARGSVTLNPEIQPGPRRISELRHAIATRGALCVFSEPQFPPRLVARLINGTAAKTGVLDPLGTGIAPGPQAYPTLMRRLARGFAACLGE